MNIKSTVRIVFLLAISSLALHAQDSSSGGGAGAGAAGGDAAGSQQSNGSGGLPLDLPVTTDQALLFPKASNAILEPGDIISVNVYGEAPLAGGIRVDNEGNVNLPYLHTVHIAGLTPSQVEDLVSRKLVAAQIFVDPEVTVSVSEGIGANAIFIGEVHSKVPIFGSRRLIDVLAAGGGLPAAANHILVISRRGVDKPIVVDLGVDPILSPSGQFLILPGDVISVQKAGVVYVLGQFKTTGVYNLSGNETTTLLQLAAKLGEPAFAAKPHELRLIRTTNGQRHFVEVDYKGIVEGKKPDPILQAGDILYMPTNAFKAAITSGGLNAGLNLINLALLAYQITRYN